MLLDRGHRVVFAAEASWAGRLEPSASSRTWSISPSRPDAEEEAAGQFWIDFVHETAPEFRKPDPRPARNFMQPT